MQLLTILGGIAWDPTIRGILTVVVAFAILPGSIYLIVATNTGARLGLLIVLAGLFGWLVILTAYWWMSPPGIGPRGTSPSWQAVEIYIDGDVTPETKPAQSLPRPDTLPTGEDILAAHPELAGEFVTAPVLSDIAGVDPEVLPSPDELGGWRVMSTSNAGEAQAAADAVLVKTDFFESTADYQKLNAFEIGGKPKRTEECDDNDVFCRVRYRVQKTLTLTHPPHYAVVQLQPVVAQEQVAGSPPPSPVIDESKPVISVVLVRDLGDVRLLPATYFLICLSLFIVFVLILHYRDKTLQKHVEAAAAAKVGT